MAQIRAHVTIHGRVQAGGFRFSTSSMASQLGLTGWVKNTWSRSVEAVFEGEESHVKSMVDWCHTGPPAARVSNVDVEYTDATGEFSSFRLSG